MKKILFLQIRDDTNGGIWFVHKTLATSFMEMGYDVKIISIRKANIKLCDTYNISNEVINLKDKWEITHKKDVYHGFKKGPLYGTKVLFQYLNGYVKLKKDYRHLKKAIINYNPNYIVASHYQVLPGIPKKYLKMTINVHHTSYEMLNIYTDNKKKLLKLKKKLYFVWLSQNSLKKALDDGFKNSFHIYNPLKFEIDLVANVTKNKKLITIARLSDEKQIPLMIKIVKEVFKKQQFKDWSFDIYGYGELEEEVKKEETKQIHFMGATNAPSKVLLHSSIYLCTSKFEGFSLSIIEGYECGLPCISFDFGETANETILDNKTGFLVKQNDIESFVQKLEELMTDNDKLMQMSTQAKQYSKQFHKQKIVNEWLHLFEKIDKED